MELENEDFEAAFDAVEAVTPETPEEPVEQPVDAESTEEAAADDAPVEPVAADSAAAPEAEAPPAAEPPAPEPAAQPPLDPKYLAQAIAEAQALAQQRPAPEAPKPQEAPKAAVMEDFLTEEQKASLAGFKSEWSEIEGPVSTLVSAHVQAALANQRVEILSQMQQHLAPIQQVTAQSQEAAHFAAVAAAHPDFAEVVTKLPAWIESQPSIVRAALQAAYEHGTAVQVVELLATYKKANGSTGAAPELPASSAAQVTPKPAPVSKAALAATLAPPKAQRSAVALARDPNDYEAAFNEGL